MSSPTDDELARLLSAVGWSANPFWRWWAKLEILLGLTAAGAGLMLGMAMTHQPPADWPVWAWGGPVALFALGGYLALAGHRSHLYQSNNRLTAYLAALLRTLPGNPP